MKACNQLCPWNTLYGCTKPESEPCILSNMPCESFEQKPQTNADHIRSMTDEELSVFLHTSFSCYGCPARIVCESADLDCDDIVFDWLKQPFDGGDT